MTTTPFADRLIAGVRAKNTPLCVGLDPFSDKVPALFGDLRTDTAAVLLKFGTSVIDIAAKRPARVLPWMVERFTPKG